MYRQGAASPRIVRILQVDLAEEYEAMKRYPNFKVFTIWLDVREPVCGLSWPVEVPTDTEYARYVRMGPSRTDPEVGYAIVQLREFIAGDGLMPYVFVDRSDADEWSRRIPGSYVEESDGR